MTGMDTPQQIVTLVESGRWPAGASSRYGAYQKWYGMTEYHIEEWMGTARRTSSVVEYNHAQDILKMLRERRDVLLTKLQERSKKQPAEEHLHIYGTRNEINAFVAVMPKPLALKRQNIFYTHPKPDSSVPTCVYNIIFAKPHFSDEEMRVVQAVAYMHPHMLYRLCDEHGQVLHNIDSDCNQNEASFVGLEIEYLKQMYSTPSYYYSFDIRCKLRLLYGALCREESYVEMAQEAEELCNALVALENTVEPDDDDALPAIASFLTARLADQQRASTADNRRENLQRRLVCKAALQMALCGVSTAKTIA